MTLEEHQDIVRTLYHRLKKSPRYDLVKQNLEYHINGFDGEFDILAITKNGNTGHYYEVKSHHGLRAYQHALKQFNQVQALFGDRDWRFIYYSPETGFRRVKV